MRIDHLAIWTSDLEKMKAFYVRYFGMVAGEKYVNPVKKFESYFLSFQLGDTARIELMRNPFTRDNKSERGLSFGYAHIAISVGSVEKVNTITQELRIDGYRVIGEPRTTGDGYYESIVADIEGNWVEITI